MASEIIQLVTFQLGQELYGVDIMMVNSIVRTENIREIPNSPTFVEGIYNLRGEIIPVINLHNRFDIPVVKFENEDDDVDGGMMIIHLKGKKVALIIDRVSRVIPVDIDKIQPPPLNFSGIGREYIRGVYKKDDMYLVLLDVSKIFDPTELQQLVSLGSY